MALTVSTTAFEDHWIDSFKQLHPQQSLEALLEQVQTPAQLQALLNHGVSPSCKAAAALLIRSLGSRSKDQLAVGRLLLETGKAPLIAALLEMHDQHPLSSAMFNTDAQKMLSKITLDWSSFEWKRTHNQLGRGTVEVTENFLVGLSNKNFTEDLLMALLKHPTAVKTDPTAPAAVALNVANHFTNLKPDRHPHHLKAKKLVGVLNRCVELMDPPARPALVQSLTQHPELRKWAQMDAQGQLSYHPRAPWTSKPAPVRRVSDRVLMDRRHKTAQDVKDLVDRGLPVNGTCKDGATYLSSAVFSGRLSTAAALLEHGADPNLKEHAKLLPTKPTLLHVACMGDTPHMAQLLLDHGATPDARDGLGNSIVHTAASGARLNILAALRGRVPNHLCDPDGNNAFWVVLKQMTIHHRHAVIEALVELGEDPFLENKAGVSFASFVNIDTLSNTVGQLAAQKTCREVLARVLANTLKKSIEEPSAGTRARKKM